MSHSVLAGMIVCFKELTASFHQSVKPLSFRSGIFFLEDDYVLSVCPEKEEI